mgnify:CR=1 FL=1
MSLHPTTSPLSKNMPSASASEIRFIDDLRSSIDSQLQSSGLLSVFMASLACSVYSQPPPDPQCFGKKGVKYMTFLTWAASVFHLDDAVSCSCIRHQWGARCSARRSPKDCSCCPLCHPITDFLRNLCTGDRIRLRLRRAKWMCILLLWVGDSALSSHNGVCGLVVATAKEDEIGVSLEIS